MAQTQSEPIFQHEKENCWNQSFMDFCFPIFVIFLCNVKPERSQWIFLLMCFYHYNGSMGTVGSASASDAVQRQNSGCGAQLLSKLWTKYPHS